jgi:hypothetical protein
MPENPARVVKVTWKDRSGNACDVCSAALTHTSDQVGIWNVTDEQHTSLWYTIDQAARINPALGLSSLSFTVTENGRTVVYDQDGEGFGPIQDTMLLSNSSCLFTDDEGMVHFRLRIAVRATVLRHIIFD